MTTLAGTGAALAGLSVLSVARSSMVLAYTPRPFVLTAKSIFSPASIERVVENEPLLIFALTPITRLEGRF